MTHCLRTHYLYSTLSFSRRHDSAVQITVRTLRMGTFHTASPFLFSVRPRQSLRAHCQQTVETHISEWSSEAPVHPLLNTSGSQVRPGCSEAHPIRFVGPTGSSENGASSPPHTDSRTQLFCGNKQCLPPRGSVQS